MNVEIGGLTTPLTAMAAVDGSWAVESKDVPFLADNTYTLRVTVTNSSGSVSDAFTLSFTVDTVAPGAPVVSRVAERSASSGMRINKANPLISGTSEAGSQVTVTISGLGALTPVDADGTGAWSVAPISALAEGDYTVTVTAKDEAGNPSESSQPLSFTVDRTIPAPPVVQKIAGKEFAADVLLNTARPQAEGTAESEGQVIFFLGDEKERIGAVTANSDGTWRLPLDRLSEGPFQEYRLFFLVKDQAGNESDYLGPIHLIIDTVAPEISVTGPPKISLVKDAVFVFTSSEDGTRIECKLDTASVFEDCGTEKSFSDLSEGTRVLQVRGVDLAGNVSALTTYDWQVDLGGNTHAIGGGLSCSTTRGSGEASLGLLALLGLGVLASRRREV